MGDKNMRRVHSITVTVALAAAAFAYNADAQGDGSTPLYVALECMKSTSANYEQLELETWKPVHQYLVDKGKRNSWALYKVVYGDRSSCDYYTVTTYSGVEQLNAEPDYAEAFAAVHGQTAIDKLAGKTLAARQHVSSELWLQVDQTELRPHRYAVINKMFAYDPVAYETMESRVFKAGHQVLIDNGHRAGWAVYALIAPLGSSIPYNYGTVDFINDLGPVPMAEAMITGNPDRDLEEMAELLELRDHVLSETWALVGATEPATED